MPRFEFRLQQYLGVKEQLEEQKEIEYAKALQKVEEEKAKLNELEAKRVWTINDLRKRLLEPISPIDIRRSNNTIEKIKQLIEIQQQTLSLAEQFAEEKRLELLEAMKERKAIEIVRDNQKEEFLIEEDKKVRKQVDELVSFKYTDKLKA